MATEQFFSSKHMVEKDGVCVEVARGKTSDLKQEDVVAKIELMMGETEKGQGKK